MTEKSWSRIPDWGQKIGELIGLKGERAKAVGTALMGSGLGAILDGKDGAISGGALGSILGGGGEQLGSMVSDDPVTARLLGDSLLGGIAGNRIKGVGGQGGATLAGFGSALMGMGDDKASGNEEDPDSAASMRDFMRRYWPVLALAGSGMYSSYEDKKRAAAASTPTMGNRSAQAGPSLSDLVGQQGQYTPFEGDYFTYGQVPSHDFYKAEGGSIDVEQPLDLMGGMPPMGGAPFDSSQQSYVGQGPGSGRDDQVPAHLSPNEYVFDAETVALLGDGSPDEGARKLDELREKIRAHKGTKLARGEISPDALGADEYLGGVV